jgi:hypothetical protein
MRVLRLEDLHPAGDLDSKQTELLNWSVLAAGNDISKKLLGKPFPHPNLRAVATLLALYRTEPTITEALLKKRSRLPSHLFMMADPMERCLKALATEHSLSISFKECECNEDHNHDQSKMVCTHCHGLIKRRARVS